MTTASKVASDAMQAGDYPTPGPWSAHAVSAEGEFAEWDIRPHVAHVFRVDIEGAANARLIAAAPELLRSLVDMLEWLDDGNRVLSDACKADVDKARAAIAKAKGV